MWDHKDSEGKDECYFYASRKNTESNAHEKSTVADANDESEPECLKRGTIHSPTPRKLKMVKQGSPLLKTQASHREVICTNQQNLEIRKSAKIKLFTPSKIKVVYRANKETETTKSRIISGDFPEVVKGIY